MAKSTADCKAFLVGFFAKNPSVVLSIFGPGMGAQGQADLVKDATNPAKWKRTHKCRPGTGPHEMATYSLFPPNVQVARMGYGVMPKAPSSAYVAERGFMLDPNTYDTGVMFLVVEDAQGVLSLADYVGD